MRLFQILLRRETFPGHKYRGKKRKIPEVTNTHLHRLKDRLEKEERNMFYLRHAFLTPEQSSGHAKALGKDKERFERVVCTNHKEYYENVSIESRLAHLRITEGWE